MAGFEAARQGNGACSQGKTGRPGLPLKTRCVQPGQLSPLLFSANEKIDRNLLILNENNR